MGWQGVRIALRAAWWRIWGSPRLVRVHALRRDESLEGVLVRYGRHELYLQHSRLLEAEDRSHLLEGTLRVRHDQVFFIQEI